MTRRLLIALAAAGALALSASASAQASAQAPWWSMEQEVLPSNLPPEGEGEKGREGQGHIIVVASDLSPVEASGATGDPIVVSDKLPAGLVATAITGTGKNGSPPTCTLTPLQCVFTGVLYPYQRVSVTITVQVAEPAGTVTTLPNQVSVEGGGAPRAVTRTERVRVNGTPTPFGVQEQGYELAPYSFQGEPETIAGAHPFQLTSTLVLNQTGQPDAQDPVALPRNLHFQLPLGLIGNPQATEQCPFAQFSDHAPLSEVDLCPANAVVGVASVTVDEPVFDHVITLTEPLFNLVPSEGEPARFGFEALGNIPVIIDTSLDPADDYDVVASVQNATEIAGLLSSQVTFWGVPGDPQHNDSRGWECINNGVHYEKKEVPTPCPTATNLPQTPLLTLPTYCPNPASEPVSSMTELESWAHVGYVKPPAYVWSGPLEEALGFTGCQELPFTPSIALTPEKHSGSTPTGLTVNVNVPRQGLLESEGRAQSDVRDTTVTLPAGVQANPSAANGLQSCSQSDIGFQGFHDFQQGLPTATFTEGFNFTPPPEPKAGESSCPQASKIGTVHIKTPLLPKELEGALYLAEPAPNGEANKNPFNTLIALYLIAEDHEAGVLVKLAGEGHLNQSTGQLSTSFRGTPQLPFEELKVELFGGQRASLSTPAVCGAYPTLAEFTPWSLPFGSNPVDRTSAGEDFDITENCSPSSPLGFSPAFDAQSTSTQAGAFTGFSLQLERPDGQQALTGLSIHLPPGISALLSKLTPCQEPAAGQPWACGPESLIGHSLASSGVGTEPVTLPGNVYLTAGYEGAPFGILDETEAKAGPFNLGEVYVRSKIEVNRETAAVTILTAPGPHGDGLPTILKGVPVDLKRLTVSVDRPEFELNPTSCSRMSITGTLDGSEGTDTGVSSPFQMGGCEALPFSPTLTASVGGHASKADGTNLNVTVTSAGVGQANIQKVDLQFPKALSSRLTTLQKACTEAAFNANPASCDPDSVIGHATVHTPILKSPLTGPAYLVSHGGAAFPDVEFVLQGEGVEIVLDGKTDIKEGITYSKFESAPDAPFTTFETELPSGPDSIFTANVPETEDYSLCKASLVMPTRIIAQDGATIEPTTKITAQGCGEVKSSKVKKLSLAQRLQQALAQCRKHYKHSKAKRAKCERSAHARYTALALAACRKQDRHSKKQRSTCESLARKRYGAHTASRGTGKTARRHG